MCEYIERSGLYIPWDTTPRIATVLCTSSRVKLNKWTTIEVLSTGTILETVPSLAVF
jgi:hypothetical protein